MKGSCHHVYIRAKASSSNLTDSGADSIIGTRGGWNKIDATQGSSNWATIGPLNLCDDTWHHLVYCGDLTDVSIYIDGSVFDDTTSTTASTFTGNMHIGGTPNWSEDMTGLMSDVAVWTERLSDERIEDLANGGPVVLPVAPRGTLIMVK